MVEAEANWNGHADHLAAGFARHMERWAIALNCNSATVEATRQAAIAVSLATGAGHVCLPLTAVAASGTAVREIGALRDRLLGSRLVGTPADAAGKPLILDSEDRLYLHRYYDYERRLARRLMRAATAAPLAVGAAARALLNQLFAGNAATAGGRTDWQKIGVALALRQRLAVVSGGPGTGKTTAVVNLLACLLEEDPDCRVVLAAPTGKAAARMTEAIRMRAEHLPGDIRGRLPAESFTIHRLLGVLPQGPKFIHHAGNPLSIDALVIDEASMLDLALATRLLEAVPDTARIVLLGDKDQLAAVESGAVFAEISSDPTLSASCRADLAEMCGLSPSDIEPAAASHPSALTDTVVWLKQNFRFAADSGIGRLAAGINGSQASETLAWLRAGTDDSVLWLDDDGSEPGEATWQVINDGYAPYIEAVRRDASDLAAIERAFSAFRVLCAEREGARGVGGINQRMEQQARDALAPTTGQAARSPWYPGRPVIVLRNDYILKLFNGDIGIALPNDDGVLAVYFPTGAGEFRAIAPARLPEHQTAFAMTVHKSQGSEFDEVAVLLPASHSRVVTRELLYTAVTRARRRVTLCTASAELTTGIETSTQRNSGLLARLAEASSQRTTTES